MLATLSSHPATVSAAATALQEQQQESAILKKNNNNNSASSSSPVVVSDFNIQLLSSEFQTLYTRITSRFDQWAALKRKEISEKRAQHRSTVAEMTGKRRIY